MTQEMELIADIAETRRLMAELQVQLDPFNQHGVRSASRQAALIASMESAKGRLQRLLEEVDRLRNPT